MDRPRTSRRARRRRGREAANRTLNNEPPQDAALAVAREFVLSGAGDGDGESCAGDFDDYGDVDAYGAFRAAAAAAAGVEKATALAIVLLVIEHGAAPFDDPEVVALCRALEPEARESLVASLEEYFGDFYDTAAVELGALRYALLSAEERRAAVAEMAAAHPYDGLPEEASLLLERLGAGGLFEGDDDYVPAPRGRSFRRVAARPRPRRGRAFDESRPRRE